MADTGTKAPSRFMVKRHVPRGHSIRQDGCAYFLVDCPNMGELFYRGRFVPRKVDIHSEYAFTTLYETYYDPVDEKELKTETYGGGDNVVEI